MASNFPHDLWHAIWLLREYYRQAQGQSNAVIWALQKTLEYYTSGIGVV